ncbi:MAG TPA: peptidyl-alpha-hydroxyglycine alpha-amidating lyase family protein [Beijerinckiaceae bacterium]|nr:peptidyl-alpha-hydroxyglycine alpha-amidating lyase family protein [Beijerinckiaceae bacterium]
MPDFLKLPKDMYLGEAAGVAVNSKGHIFVFHRGNVTGAAYKAQAAQLLEFGPDGKYIREIGHNLYAWSFAHAVKVDRYDNIWAVDKGSDTIVRFNPAGRVTMVFGRKQEASDEGSEPYKREGVPWPTKFDDGRFRLPTDVAWDSKDNSYFSDGYWNSRVGKADKDGVWLKSWGSHGKGTGQFDTPHSIAVDAHDNVYVADRGNGRIQVFDTEGNFVRAISMQNVPLPPGSKPAIGNQPPSLQGYQGSMTQMQGAPWAICITPPPSQVLYMADAFPGRVYKMSLDGKLLGTFGKSGKLIKQFGWIHEMACPSENVLFVAEVLNWRVQKLILHPTAAESASAQ